MARNAVSTALVFGIAFLIGFDAAASPLEWLAAIGLIALYVLALTWVAVAIGIVASGPEAASGFTFAVLFLPYVSSAFVPPETMPAALETIATFNPVTPITDTLRGLLLGTPVDGSALAGAAVVPRDLPRRAGRGRSAVPSEPLNLRLDAGRVVALTARPASAAGITPGRRTTLPGRRSAPGPSRRRRVPRPTAAGRR